MIAPAEFRDQLSRVIQVVVLSILLVVCWAAASELPGSQTELLDGLRVEGALRLAVGALLLGLALSAAGPLGVILAHYGATLIGVRLRAADPTIGPAVSAVARYIARILVLVLIWRIAQAAVPFLMAMRTLRQADWLPSAITLGFLAGLIVLLLLAYTAARPLFDLLSLKLSDRIAGASETQCERCGAPNPAGVRFCGSCGAQLAVPAAPTGSAQPLKCAACGAENPVGGRFCSSCGAELAAPPAAAVSAELIKCSACGAENPPDSRFCISCGGGITDLAAT